MQDLRIFGFLKSGVFAGFEASLRSWVLLMGPSGCAALASGHELGREVEGFRVYRLIFIGDNVKMQNI